MKVCWISAGISSFVAGYLAKDSVDKFIYIDIKDQHPDSIRFIRDCESVLGKRIEILKSREYDSVEDAILAAGVICNYRRRFFPCTNYLKKRVRKQWEQEHVYYEITYVWGLDVDEKRRAENITEAMPEFHHEFPLIENNLSKQDAHAISARLGIKRPFMYEIGYNNNNCIGCVKGGMGYWNKIRVDFPEVYESRAKLERKLNSKILKECYLDELEPDRGRIPEEIMEDCGIFCELALK